VGRSRIDAITCPEGCSPDAKTRRYLSQLGLSGVVPMIAGVRAVVVAMCFVAFAHSQSGGEPPLAGPPTGTPIPRDPARTASPSAPGALEPGIESQGTYNPQDPPAPVVTVRVRVPAAVSPGGEAIYKIHVDNVSSAMAHRVRVRNPIPAHAKFISADPKPEIEGQELVWLFGSMKPGEQRVITMVLQADGMGDLESTARVGFEHGQTTRTRVASAMRITKKAPERALVFDSWTYTIDVFNSGASAIADVVVVDTVPDGLEFLTSTPSTKGENPLTWSIGRIEAGQSKRIEYQVSARKAGEYETPVKLTAAGGISRDATCRTVVGESKLRMYKSGPDRRAVGRPATYHITMENDGATQVKNIRVSSKIDPTFVMLAASGGGRVVGGEVVWDIPTLDPNQRKTLQLVVRATMAGELISRAECIAERLGTGIQGEKNTVFEQKKDLVIEVDKTVDPVEVGENATYTIKVVNMGAAAVAASTLQVTLPQDWKNASGRGSSGTATVMGTALSFGQIPAIDPGREYQFQVTGIPSAPSKGQIKADVVVGGVNAASTTESVQVLSAARQANVR